MDKIYTGIERRISPGDAHYFFGYFDKCPWNSRGEHLIHKVAFAGKHPRFGDVAEIGIINHGKFEKAAETLAWCWQQGAMLQWFDDDRFIWNDTVGDSCISRLSDGTVFEQPVYTLSDDRSFALSLNFARLDAERPGYGYPGLADPAYDYAFPDFDGIYRLDFTTGKSKLIVSLQRLVDEFWDAGADRAINWVNHLTISPDGKKIAFIHRWRSYEFAGRGRRSYITRMFVADADGSNLWKLPLNRHASHYTWFAPEKLIAFSNNPDFGNQYRIYTVGNDRPEVFAPGRLPNDGHCSFSPDGKLLLTDSYPGKDHIRELVLYNPAKDERYSLGRYYSPDILQPTRCDLHPRWSADGRRISFDSFHEKYRGTYVIDIPEDILR